MSNFSEKEFVIIVAGGSGSRMNSEIPKQFILLKGKPILMHTIEAFKNYNSSINIILVLPQSQINYWKELVNDFSFQIHHTICSGGKERFHSVKNGLSLLAGEKGTVGIHDGVRPLASENTIKNSFESAKKLGSGIPVIEMIDSIRKIEGKSNKMINRKNFLRIQTPQCFDLESLISSYEQPFINSFTDDASVFEKAGYGIHLTEGNAENIKVTTPTDLKIAEALLND